MRDQDLELLRDELQRIKSMGWIKNRRPGNAGGVGNTLEDLLNVAENNLQLPDFGEWELKSQRAETGSLLTLFHTEPKPRNARIVPNILLPLSTYISASAQHFGCQFILSTHSPVLLAMEDAVIYDLDTCPVETRNWTELENVRRYFDFFEDHRAEFTGG